MKIKTDWDLKENSSVELKLTVPEKELKSEHDELVEKYCKVAVVKGFRKGKVPREILLRKYGESIRGEVVQNIISKSVESAMENTDYKPLPYSQPKLVDEDKIDFDNFNIDKPFEFKVAFDVFPEITLGTYKNIAVNEIQVSIGKEDMEKELKDIQERNALILDKKDSKVEKDNTVTIDYAEIEDDNEKEGTKREGFTFTVGTGYNIYKIDEDIIGMNKDEEKIIEKDYPEDFENKDLAGKKIKIKVKVTAVKEKNLPEINDELAQDVSEKYKTLLDLKADIEKRLKDNAGKKVRQKKIEDILAEIKKNSGIPLPESMVQNSLNMRYREFIGQLGGNENVVQYSLQQQGKTLSDLFNEWKPGVEDNVKSGLIIDKIIKLEKIEVTDKELDEELKKMADLQNKDYKEIKELYEKNNMINYLKENLATEKVYNLLLDNAVVKKGEKVKYLDLIRGKQ